MLYVTCHCAGSSNVTNRAFLYWETALLLLGIRFPEACHDEPIRLLALDFAA